MCVAGKLLSVHANVLRVGSDMSTEHGRRDVERCAYFSGFGCGSVHQWNFSCSGVYNQKRQNMPCQCLAKCGDGGACDLAHAVYVLEIECENFDVILDLIAPAGSDDFQFYGK